MREIDFLEWNNLRFDLTESLGPGKENFQDTSPFSPSALFFTYKTKSAVFIIQQPFSSVEIKVIECLEIRSEPLHVFQDFEVSDWGFAALLVRPMISSSQETSQVI